MESVRESLGQESRSADRLELSPKTYCLDDGRTLANSESGWLSSCLLWRRTRNNEVVVVVADYWFRILGRDGPDFRLRDHASYLSSSMETLVESGLNR